MNSPSNFPVKGVSFWLAPRVGIAMLVGVGTLAGALPASAQELKRPDPLAGAPAVRHRRELRNNRFRVGVGIGSTVAQDFVNTTMLNLNLGYHVADWLSFSGYIGQKLVNINTGFSDNLDTTLGQQMGPAAAQMNTPSKEEANNGWNYVERVMGAQLEITPIAGKFSMFQKFFANFDFYLTGGAGMMTLGSDGPECGVERVAKASCPVVGNKPVLTAGAGMNVFFNDFIALNLDLKDYFMITGNNPAGRDVQGDGFATKDDNTFDQIFILGANVRFYFPRIPVISD